MIKSFDVTFYFRRNILVYFASKLKKSKVKFLTIKEHFTAQFHRLHLKGSKKILKSIMRSTSNTQIRGIT